MTRKTLFSRRLPGSPRLALALGLTLLAGCTPASAAPEAATALAITNVTVIDGTGSPPRRNQTVLVEGSRLVAIGPSAQLRVPLAATRVNGTGKYLIPGLWDMHAHSVGWHDTDGHAALRMSLANGVTGLRDMGSHPYQRAKEWRDGVAAGRILGPRMKIAAPVVENANWLATVRGWEEEAGMSTEWMNGRFGPSSQAEARRFVDSAVHMGADHIKVRNWPPAEIAAALVDRARERGIPVVAHANLPFPRAGVTSFEHTVFPGMSSGRDTLFRQWGASGTAFVPTLVAFTARLHPADSVIAWLDPARTPKLRYAPLEKRKRWKEQLEVMARNEQPFDWQGHYRDALRNLREMRSAGVTILAGSDFGAHLVVPGLGLHEELEKLVHELGFTPVEAIQAATIRPAEFFGHARDLGTIEPGKFADLVLLDGDPLADIRNTRSVRAVVVGGRLLDRTKLDQLLAEAEQGAAGP